MEVHRGAGGHLATGDPAELLLRYVARSCGIVRIVHASATATGSLATSEVALAPVAIGGKSFTRSKSDLVLRIAGNDGNSRLVGISTKQCNNLSPTNAQLYFTTAQGFVNLLKAQGVVVSDHALRALRQFCGEPGYRPLDDLSIMAARGADSRRFFWEEIHEPGRKEWEKLFFTEQRRVTEILLRNAYLNDPLPPDYLLHKTCRAEWHKTEVAIYSMSELVELSSRYQPFMTREYSVRKGSGKDAPGVVHQAPRFGVIQMQRGGQKQHPEQLQFNLEASYFRKISPC